VDHNQGQQIDLHRTYHPDNSFTNQTPEISVGELPLRKVIALKYPNMMSKFDIALFTGMVFEGRVTGSNARSVKPD